MAKGTIEVNNIGKTYANVIHGVQGIIFRVTYTTTGTPENTATNNSTMKCAHTYDIGA